MKFITVVNGTKSIVLNTDFIVRVDVGEDLPHAGATFSHQAVGEHDHAVRLPAHSRRPAGA